MLIRLSQVHQCKYASYLLRKINMQHYNLAKTPSETCMKLERNGSEKEVNATYIKKIAESLRQYVI